jgi:hypothetical protein
MTPPPNETERQLVDALHNVSLPVASNWWLVLREDGSYITDLGDREVEYGVVMEELSSFAASLDGLTAVAGRELFGHYATRANILADKDGMLVCHYLTQEIVWVLSHLKRLSRWMRCWLRSRYPTCRNSLHNGMNNDEAANRDRA